MQHHSLSLGQKNPEVVLLKSDVTLSSGGNVMRVQTDSKLLFPQASFV